MKKIILIFTISLMSTICFAGATPTPTPAPTLTVYAVTSVSTTFKVIFLDYQSASNFIKAFKPSPNAPFYGMALTVTALILTTDPNNTTYKVGIYLDGSKQATATFQGYGIEINQNPLSTQDLIFTGETPAFTPAEAIDTITAIKNSK